MKRETFLVLKSAFFLLVGTFLITQPDWFLMRNGAVASSLPQIMGVLSLLICLTSLTALYLRDRETQIYALVMDFIFMLSLFFGGIAGAVTTQFTGLGWLSLFSGFWLVVCSLYCLANRTEQLRTA